MKLLRLLPKKSGRARGTITVRHQGGRHKRFLRKIDWKRDKQGVEGLVERIEYDPNRNARLALVAYTDGERRYILAPDGLVVGNKIMSGPDSPMDIGNALPLAKIPVGTTIHNIEIVPGKGGQLVKSAGSQALIQGKDETHVLIKLASGEVKRFNPNSMATLGQVGNVEAKTVLLGKAGRKRRMGVRPTVRGTAQNPRSHPHGGGEGRSGVGMKYPKTPWGRPAVGNTRKRRKYSDRFIVERKK